MKRLKRKTAAVMSTVLLFTGIPVSPAVAAQDDGMVTVKVENIPGGIIRVWVTREDRQYIPIDKKVSIPRGTMLYGYASSHYYSDGSYTEAAGITVNGAWQEESNYFNVVADEDLLISGLFLRYEGTEEEQELYESPRFKVQNSYTSNKKITGSRVEEPLYNSRTKERIREDLEIVMAYQYNDTSTYGEEIDPASIDASIKRGVLHASNLKSGSAYRLTVKDGENENQYILWLNVDVNQLEPYFVLANFKDPDEDYLSDQIVVGDTVYVGDSEKIGTALQEQENVLLGTTFKGWTDWDGKLIDDETVASQAWEGNAQAYASYTDYEAPLVEVPEISEGIAIEKRTGADGDPMYVFRTSGEPVKNAFLSEDGTNWVYLDNEGMAVKDSLFEVRTTTAWYQNTNMDSGLYLKQLRDEGETNKLLYYAGAEGKLVKNSWVAVDFEGTRVDSYEYWYYFDQNGRAFADGSWTIKGKQYHFDEEGRCLMPGWFVQDDTWVFLDTDGKTVKNAFVKSGEDTFYIGADGHLTEEAQVVKTNRNTLFYTEGKELGEITWSKPNQDYKFRSIYYLIDDEGKIQTDAWDESHEMYFGKDGKAYQDCTAVIDGELYTFDRDGIGEVREPIEEGAPNKVAGEVEKLDLMVNEEDANTREEVAAFVEEAVTAVLPMGYEVATVSDAKRAGDKAFQAAENGKDGFWRYDAELVYGDIVATDSVASGSSARRARVATGSTAEDGRSTVIAENCLLTIRASVVEPEDNKLQQTVEAAADAVKKLALTQENTPDQKAAEKAISDAIEAVLPEGYKASYRFEYQAPVAGTRADRDGADGWIKVTCTIKDADGYEMTFAETAAIAATPYTGSGTSSNGGSSGGGSSTGGRAAVMDTVGTWQQDATGWRFLVQSTGTYAQNAWHRINGKWYYFGQNTYAVTGWNLIDGKWYYMDETNCDMQTGWHEDKADGNWYFLHQDGSLALGWIQVGGKSYYLNMISEGPTYTQDAATGRWFFNGNSNLPYGAMLKSTRTPDGYFVGADGAWDGNPKA